MTVDAARLAATLSASLPALDVERLAGACLAGPHAVLALRADVGTAALRRACTALLGDHDLTALGTALHAAGLVRAEPKDRVEVVWTGPDSGTGGRRLTASVVTDLIDSARRELLLIGYAVQDEPHVVAALEAAVARGIILTVLLENMDDNPRFTGQRRPFRHVDCTRLAWPRELRPHGASLHAKVLVVDDNTALIGSANVTGAALALNLECGALVHGRAAAQVLEHVAGLRQEGTLTLLSTEHS